MQKFFLICVLVSNAAITHAQHRNNSNFSWWYPWCMLLSGGNYQCANNSDELRDAIKVNIGLLFSVERQPEQTRHELSYIQERMTEEVMRQLNMRDSWHAIQQKAQDLTRSAVLQYIVQKTQEHALDIARSIRSNPPVNPEYLKAVTIDEVVKKTEKIILHEAQSVLANNNNNLSPLQGFIGEQLVSKIRVSVESEFGVHNALHQTTSAPIQSNSRPAQATKPVVTKEVYEIYPDFQDNDRNKDYHRRRENGQWHREESCSVCLENFLELPQPKRVTLFCGHSICPTCLFDMLYMAHNKACPLCRDAIRLDEFSVNHLRRHVDVKVLQENHPGQHSKIQQYFHTR